MKPIISVTSSLSIAAGLFGVLAASRLSKRNDGINSIRKDILNFKAATNILLPFDFARYRSALNDIMPILPKCYQRKLQKAWDEYCRKDYDGWSIEDDIGECSVEQILEAMSQMSEDDKYYKIYQKRFKEFHQCLDGLLK